jgi:hypothetical protein
MEAEEETKIYPNLPVLQENLQSFRLTQISEIKTYFEDELEFRRKIFSKYKKAFDVITGINQFLNLSSVAAGSLGVTALAGVITATIGMALGGVTIGSAIISSALNWKKKTIIKKLCKHEQIFTLAI